MRTHPLRSAAIAVALLSLTSVLSAQGRGPGFGPGSCGAPGEGRGFRGLNLSEAQQTQMKAIHDHHQAAFKAKGEVAETARKALHDAMANASTDTKTLQALHEKVSAAQFELMLEHRALRQEILPILNAEQKAAFERREMRMGRHRGRGMGSGMRPHMGPGMGPGSGPQPGMRPDSPAVKPS